MNVLVNVFVNSCDVYRPFGAGTPTLMGVACRLEPNLPAGRGAYSGAAYPVWTHVLDMASSVDVRDGCSRTAGTDAIAYADGDEVRVNGTRYVVVWVEVHNPGTSQEFKRAYLLRDTAAWPGP
jgi:hypothetical protein